MNSDSDTLSPVNVPRSQFGGEWTAENLDRLANGLHLSDRIHLWPDKSPGNLNVANRMSKPKEHMRCAAELVGPNQQMASLQSEASMS